MPYSIAPVIERATTGINVGVHFPAGDQIAYVDDHEYICAFSVRSKFDSLNFDKAIEKGVAFEIADSIDAIDERTDHVTVQTAKRKYRARYLIGADGANSVVRRLAGPKRHFFRGFAIEGLIPYSVLGREPKAEFLFNYVPHGYGWLFPKKDHVNVGIYTCDANSTLSKSRLIDYARSRAGTDRVEHIIGFPLGFGGDKYVPLGDRVLLAGDAAGFAEPLLGEGIHNAIKSGQAAARAILEAKSAGSVRAAYRELLSPIYSDIARCNDLALLFFYPNITGIGAGALAFPLSRMALMRGFAAGKTMYELTNTFFLSPFFSAARPASLADFLRNNLGVIGRA
jgi:flavin-dependent dehydrogenase